MKKLLLGILTVAATNLCTAQVAGQKEEAKFTPPVIRKDKPAAKTDNSVKPSHRKHAKRVTTKSKEKVTFTPPVIVKDKEQTQ
ncbi:MAG: hypothetical protein U0X40_11360 [Ferruginibacter sp.]